MLALHTVSNVLQCPCPSDQLELLVAVNDLDAMLKAVGGRRLADTSHVAVHRCGQLFRSGGAWAVSVELSARIDERWFANTDSKSRRMGIVQENRYG